MIHGYFSFSPDKSSHQNSQPLSLDQSATTKIDSHLTLANSFQWIQDDDLLIAIEGVIERDLLCPEDNPKGRYYKLIADSFRERGNDFYEKIDGLFLILIYDLKKKQLQLFNNRYQTTTLYYAEQEEGFYFSQSLSQLLKLRQQVSKVSPQVHLGSVRSFLSNGFTMTDQTQIQGVKKLLPSFRIEISGNSPSAQLSHHWQNEFSFERKKFSDLDDHIDRYESLFQRGITGYLEQYESKEVGTLLSGGHDTSFVMIHTSKVWQKPIHAFTATFPGWAFDEASYAKNICDKSGGVFHEIPFTPDDLDSLVSLIRANEEPVVGSSLPIHLCAKEAARWTDTMMAGDGGDTLWGEYYPVAELHRYAQHLPLALRQLTHAACRGLLKVFDWERFWELEHVASLFAQENYYDDFMRRLCTYRHFRDDYIPQLFHQNFLKPSTPEPSTLQIPFNRENFHEALIEGKLFNAFYTYQSFHTTKSMEHFGLNFFLPVIQRDFMRFITELPLNYVNGGNTFHRLTNNKTINRRFHKLALARHLKQEEIYNRSFDIPWYNILRPRTKVLELLQKRLLKRGWFNEVELQRLFTEFSQQSVKDYELLELKHHGYRIFTLLSLEVWMIEYIDGRMSEKPDERIPLEDYLASGL